MGGALVLYLLQDQAAVPEGDAWLSGAERARQARLHVPKRRADWRLGRYAAKRALTLALGEPEEPSRLEVRAAPGGAPELWRSGREAPFSLSLSHSGGRALVALAPRATAVGCDLETVEARSPAFLEDYFTASERSLLAGAEPAEAALLATVFWSAKESALKALGEGLRESLQALSVILGPRAADPRSWQPVALQRRSGPERWSGFWCLDNGQVLAVVSWPPCSPPEDLAVTFRPRHPAATG